jgi:hypothetical protein
MESAGTLIILNVPPRSSSLAAHVRGSRPAAVVTPEQTFAIEGFRTV